MEINILGYGQMAKQIAALFFLGGYNVTIWNHTAINDSEIFKSIKLLNKFMASAKSGNIYFENDIKKLKDNLTIEAIVEELDIKKNVFNATKNIVTKGFYTNSSSYAPNEIGETVGGLHFYNPITLKIIELYKPSSYSSSDLDNILIYLENLSYEIIEVNSNRCYVGNYILFHEISSVLKLIEKKNYSVDKINSLYTKLYEGRNIFSIIDRIGVDVVFKILQNLKEDDETIYFPSCLQTAINKNILGKKNKTSICSVINP